MQALGDRRGVSWLPELELLPFSRTKNALMSAGTSVGARAGRGTWPSCLFVQGGGTETLSWGAGAELGWAGAGAKVFRDPGGEGSGGRAERCWVACMRCDLALEKIILNRERMHFPFEGR